MAPADKKQRALTSFFSKPSSTPVKTATPARSVTPTVRSRPIDDENDDNDDIVQPDAKRRRTTALTGKTNNGIEDDEADELEEEEGNEEPSSTLRPVSGNGRLVKAVPLRSPGSARTSKYLFSSSALQENQDEDVDPAEQQRLETLHRKFVRKLGKPDSIGDIKRRNHILNGEDEEADGDEDGEEEIEESPKPVKGRAATKSASTKLTPMEKQYLDIKKNHLDTVLVVEVGYKFRFFGEDARIAAKELSIVCIPGKYRYDEHPSEAHINRFASASFPTHRLHVHVKRLVTAGHKVGVVRQIETAALKSVGDNRNAPFVRKLTNLYTKGTYIDDIDGLEEEAGTPAPDSPSTGFLLCMTENNVKGFGHDEKVHVGIVAVQPATGEIIYDDFEDGFMRSDIETRLLHVAPCEILIVGELSKATERLVHHLSGSKTNTSGVKVRVERVSKQKTFAAEAHNHISNFYAERLRDADQDDGKARKILDRILGLPEHVTVCLSAMITHMSDYSLEHVFNLTKYFQPFAGRAHMLLNGNTLSSLEVYQNQTDYTTKGSLLWTLDRTLSKFGGRLLRKWVGRPLLDKDSIEARLAAVEELLDADKAMHVEKVRHVLAKVRIDLEKSLIRIYYGICTRPELLKVLQALQGLAIEFSHVKDASSSGFHSSLITSALTSLPAILTTVLGYLEKINMSAAKENDKYAFFRTEHETESISEHKDGIASVEHDLDSFRIEAAHTLGKKQPVNFITNSAIDYLIEVENSSATIKKVPATWIKVNGTKRVSRFHTPEVVKLIKERDLHKESLAAACDVAYKDLLANISNNYQLFRDTIQNLAVLDCLLSLATVASQPGYVKPTFASKTGINVVGARHPMIEQLLLNAYVPNDITLSQSSTRALLVTGPNMGGKSSYVRSVALITIMSQIGSFVPADSAELGIVDAVFTRMGANDNMMAGESTFMVELSETSDILKLATERSLVVLDELGRGTSTFDGMAIASSVLDFLVREKRCMTLFITHYQALARMEGQWPNGELRNVHMKFSHSGSGKEGDDMEAEGEEEVTFLYEVGEGVSYRSYGLNVARLAGLNKGVLGLAGEKSRELEGVMKGRRVGGLGRMLGVQGTEAGGDALDDDVLQRIVEGIEGL